MNFVALDVETANENLASICQIGAVVYEEGVQVKAWTSLIDPQDEFSEINISIHGIDERTIKGAPRLPDLYETLQSLFQNKTVVCHTAFDRASLYRAQTKYALPTIDCQWLDSARVVRRAWPQFSERGYGLANVAQALGIEFKHHDALEDARACAEILLRAINESGSSIEAWIERLQSNECSRISRQGDGDGPLVGELVVFTGALSISRSKAADLAAQAGADVAPGVTKKTTLLVVGDQDILRLAGHEKSSKHRKAENLIHAGVPLRILTESDFGRLVADE